MKDIKSLVMIGLLSASMLVSVGCQSTSDVIYESDVMKITLDSDFTEIIDEEQRFHEEAIHEYVANVTVENKIEEDFEAYNFDWETRFNGRFDYEEDVVYCRLVHAEVEDFDKPIESFSVSNIKTVVISIFDEDVTIEDVIDGKVEVIIYGKYTDGWEELDF